MSPYPEEEFDRLEAKVARLQELVRDFCFTVRWATNLETGTAAAEMALDSLKLEEAA